MTQINATTVNDQIDYLGDKDPGMFTNIFSPRNAGVDDDDEDDDDEVIPDDDDDLYDDDDEDEEVFPDELDKIDDDDDADIIDADTDKDDDRGSVTSDLKGGSSFADRSQGRTTGRMIDHEPGSPNTGI